MHGNVGRATATDWLPGISATGWTVTGMPTGLKYTAKKVTKKSGKVSGKIINDGKTWTFSAPSTANNFPGFAAIAAVP
ncbi:MAG: hypothetical protein IJ658_09855 [Kiritimatiellae bacterium]|nr:hypothetical protein [Kiritimatiellia bacterium]